MEVSTELFDSIISSNNQKALINNIQKLIKHLSSTNTLILVSENNKISKIIETCSTKSTEVQIALFDLLSEFISLMDPNIESQISSNMYNILHNISYEVI